MKITSLCYIPEPQPNGQHWVQRIADLNNGMLWPFFRPQRAGEDKRPENKARFPIKDTRPKNPGEIGIWDWDVDENGFVSSTRYRYDCVPVQCFTVSPSHTANEPNSVLNVAGILRQQGVGSAIRAPIVLVSVTAGTMLCFNRGDFDDKGYLKPSILTARLVSIGVEVRRDASFFSDDRHDISLSYCTLMSIPPGTDVALLDSLEVVRRIVEQKTTWPVLKANGVTRSDKDTFNSILKEIDLFSLDEEVAKTLNCSPEAARCEIKRFCERAESFGFLDGPEGLLATALDNSEWFRQKCIAVATELGIDREAAKMNARLAELGERISKAEKRREELETTIQSLANQRGLQERNLKSTDESIVAKKQELINIESSVDSVHSAFAAKLAEIKADIPKALAEISVLQHLLAPSNGHGISTGENLGYAKGRAPEYESAAIPTIAEAVHRLSENLQRMGGRPQRCEWLSAMLITCFAEGRSVLFAGANAEAFAHAWSISLWGWTSGLLDCATANVASGEAAVLNDDCPVCLVRSPFEPRWTSRIPTLIERGAERGKTFCVCTSTAEDLALEPPGFFRHLVPVFTEPFVAGLPGKMSSLVPGRVTNKPRNTSRPLIQVPSELGLRPAIRTEVEKHLAFAACIGGFSTETAKSELGLFAASIPWALALGKTEALRESVQSDQHLPPDIKDEALAYLG